ncbi:MAG: hypothetical protein FD131_3252 [Rhodocyclaceae bacterium]|nr:MAG: hypothetical protein FD131_3252 [Rhodocyclaceae bacterium]
MTPPSFSPVRLVLAVLVMLTNSLTGAATYPLRIERIELDGGAALYAVNDGPAVLDVVLDLTNSINVSSDRPWPVTATVPPHSQKTLTFLFPANPRSPYQWDFRPTVTVSSVSSENALESASSGSQKDVREEAQAELRRLLEPAARMSMKLSGKAWPGVEPSPTGQTVRAAIPFLVRVLGLFLSFLLGIRVFASLAHRNWSRAGISAMVAATVDYGLVNHLSGSIVDIRSWQIDGFNAFVWHNEWSIPIIAGILIACSGTARFLLHEDAGRPLCQQWPPYLLDTKNTVFYKLHADKSADKEGENHVS